jgi:hypothetical protein
VVYMNGLHRKYAANTTSIVHREAIESREIVGISAKTPDHINQSLEQVGTKERRDASMPSYKDGSSMLAGSQSEDSQSNGKDNRMVRVSKKHARRLRHKTATYESALVSKIVTARYSCQLRESTPPADHKCSMWILKNTPKSDRYRGYMALIKAFQTV